MHGASETGEILSTHVIHVFAFEWVVVDPLIHNLRRKDAYSFDDTKDTLFFSVN